MRYLIAILLTACALSVQARDAHQVTLFRADHPCPATGAIKGKCPGYVVDHIVPLCGGGADAPHNMAWQALAASKAKDGRERKYCNCLKSAVRSCVWGG